MPDSVDPHTQFVADASTKQDGEEMGMEIASAISAKIFNDLPLIGPAWKVAAIEAQANMASRLPEARLFLSKAVTEQQGNLPKADEEEPDLIAFRASFEIIEQQHDRQRELDEAYWANRKIAWGNYELTGTEWKAVSQLMSSDAFRKTMRARGKAEGWTDEEMDEAETLAPAIAAALARGQKPTPEQQAIIDANPALKAWLDAGVEQGRKIGFSNDIVMADKAINHSGVEAIAAGTNALENGSGLAAVKPIAPLYSTLATGEVPLRAHMPAAEKTKLEVSQAQTDMGLNF